MAERISGLILQFSSPDITAVDRLAHYPSFETYSGLHLYSHILLESETTIGRASFQRRATQTWTYIRQYLLYERLPATDAV